MKPTTNFRPLMISMTLVSLIICAGQAQAQRRPVSSTPATPPPPATSAPASAPKPTATTAVGGGVAIKRTAKRGATRTSGKATARVRTSQPSAPAEDSSFDADADENTDRGDAFAEQGRYGDAAQAYRQALNANSNNAYALQGLGDAYLNLGRAEQAIDTYKQLTRLRPRSADAWFSLGDAYSYLGRYGESLNPYKQAIALRPTFAEAYYGLGEAYRFIELYEQAVLQLKQALRYKANYADAYYSLGMTYMRMGNRDAALEQYNALKGLDSYLANKLQSEIR
jgi:tetratricopeptide (TPR) repeat protein